VKILNGDDDNYDDRGSAYFVRPSLSSMCDAPSYCDGGEVVYVRKVAVNILNDQQQTSDKGCPPVWFLGEVLTTVKYFTKLRTGTDNLE